MFIGAIKGTYITASTAVTTSSAYVHAITVVSTASAGTVTIRDGGATGTVLWQIGTSAVAGISQHCTFPGLGLECSTSLYVVLSNAYASICYSGE